jgi:hypothetical protein
MFKFNIEHNFYSRSRIYSDLSLKFSFRLSNHELDFHTPIFLATLSLLAFKFTLNLIMAILITVLSNF